MIAFVIVVLLDYEFAGKKDIDFSMLDQRFPTVTACDSFRAEYIKKYHDIRGSACIEFKGSPHD